MLLIEAIDADAQLQEIWRRSYRSHPEVPAQDGVSDAKLDTNGNLTEQYGGASPLSQIRLGKTFFILNKPTGDKGNGLRRSSHGLVAFA